MPKKINTPAAQHPLRRPLSQCDSPVFVSDSDDDDIVIKSTWRTRHSKPKPSPMANKNNAPLCDREDGLPSLALPPIPSPFSRPLHKTLTSLASPKRTLSAPSKLDESASSEEEFTSLLERLKKKNKFPSTSFSPKNTHGNCFIWIVASQQSQAFVFILVVRLFLLVCFVFLNLERYKEPPVSVPPVKGLTTPASKSLGETPLHVKTPGKSTTLKPTVSQTEPRHGPTSRYIC